jgi:hypothetical protein
MIELIMANPYNNWAFSFVGSVKKVYNGSSDPCFFGMVEIDQDKVC